MDQEANIINAIAFLWSNEGMKSLHFLGSVDEAWKAFVFLVHGRSFFMNSLNLHCTA